MVGDAGHNVRLLVRDAARLQSSAQPIGVDTSDVAIGDITDADSVARALDGCDAVVHCAAVVATDPRRASEVLETNLAGARHVLGGAADLGMDPVVHVSSITALFTPRLDRMHADLPVTGGTDAYGRSKAAVDRYARDLQDRGVPVVITYPGMVLGPPAGVQFGEVADGVETVLKTGIVPGRDAAWTLVDVRDLAAVHAALLAPGRGPRRYMAGGNHLTAAEVAQALREATGRHLALVPVPGGVLRSLGRTADLVSRVVPLHLVLTEAAMQYYTQMPPSDDRPSHRDLGATYRPPAETLRATIGGLARVGRITNRQAGNALPN
jgi:nucleoside-diphosphate-sugar epimerase